MNRTDFSENQFDFSSPDGIEKHFWIMTRNRIIAKSLKKVMKTGSTALDVGCGRGVVVKYLRDEGIDCLGVEPAITQPLAGVGNYIHFGKNAVELTAAERNRYDIILLIDVIEHIRDPITFLRTVINSFPNLAYMIITVPARPELWSNYDEFYGHYRRYTIEMIQVLSKHLGVGLARQSYFFHSLYIPAKTLTKIGIHRSIKIRPPCGMLKWLHKLFSHVLVCEHHMLPMNLPGTSIVATFSLGKSTIKWTSPAGSSSPRYS
jgi:hypothetical protein